MVEGGAGADTGWWQGTPWTQKDKQLWGDDAHSKQKARIRTKDLLAVRQVLTTAPCRPFLVGDTRDSCNTFGDFSNQSKTIYTGIAYFLYHKLQCVNY